MVKIMRICKIQGFNKNAILLMRKQGIPVYDHYKMFNRNYNIVSQKRLAKFALINYRINFRNYGIPLFLIFLLIIAQNFPIMLMHNEIIDIKIIIFNYYK